MKIVCFLYSPIYLCGFPLPLCGFPLPLVVIVELFLCGFPLPAGVIGGSSGSAKDVIIHPETKARATKQISTRDAIFTNTHLLLIGSFIMELHFFTSYVRICCKKVELVPSMYTY
jgi:hypothetical protein